MNTGAAATYERVRAACCCEFSGLSPAELERHVQRITLTVIDARRDPRYPTSKTTATLASDLDSQSGEGRRRSQA